MLESIKEKFDIIVKTGKVAQAIEDEIEAIKRSQLEDIPNLIELFVALTNEHSKDRRLRSGGIAEESKIEIIDYLVNYFCTNHLFDIALDFLKAPFSDREDEEMYYRLMEWEFRILLWINDSKHAVMSKKLQQHPKYTDYTLLPGTLYAIALHHKEEDAIELCKQAVAEAERLGKNQEGRHYWIKDHIAEATGRVLVRDDATEKAEAKEKAEAEAKVKAEAKEKELRKRVKPKRKDKPKKEGVTKAEDHVGVEDEEGADETEGVKDIEGVKDTVVVEQPDIELNDFLAANVEFSVPCSVELKQSSGRGCFTGYLQTNASRIKKSFIEAEVPHVLNLQKLVDVCSKNEHLLTIEQGLKNNTGSTFLVSECVQTVEKYFELKFLEFTPNTIQEWWIVILEDFWIIFRDAIRGLMHLFVNGLASGNVSFNIFVTDLGRGRILPSLDSLNQKDDLKQLSNIMKSIITYRFPGQDLSFLPFGLKDFFEHIDKANELLPRVLPQFLLDHPYFWSIIEKIDFSKKLKNFVWRSPELRHAMEGALDDLRLYKDWTGTVKLNGIYDAIRRHASLTTNDIRSYKSRIDVIRFFNAVYVHANDSSYSHYRQNKRLEAEDIERYMISRFPNYYTNIFKCLCSCAFKRTEGTENVMEVSSIYFRAEDSPTIMVRRTRPETT